MATRKKKKTAAKQGSKTIDFVRAYLRKKPTAEFADVRDAAARRGLNVIPVVYGRAKTLEGLVKPKPGGGRKKAGRRKVSGRGPGRPRKSAPASFDSLDSLIAGMKAIETERDAFRDALDRIRGIADSALS